MYRAIERFRASRCMAPKLADAKQGKLVIETVALWHPIKPKCVGSYVPWLGPRTPWAPSKLASAEVVFRDGNIPK